SYIEKQGLDGTGYCDVPSIPQWHFDYQLKRILQMIWKNPDETIETLVASIEENYAEVERREDDTDTGRLIREKKRLDARLKTLMDMRLDEELDKDSYAAKRAEIMVRLTELEHEINERTGRNELPAEIEDRDVVIANIRKALEETADIDGKFVDESLIGQVVERVIPYKDGTFKWYLNIGREPLNEFSENSYAEYGQFDISFEEAKSYRKRFGNFIRMRQWRDIHVLVYMRV
ncbi:MAG: hypothetical protein NC548_61645, partial [Lachnospiraceae bacterium]|nr:hypothetical protein [Lachnospiraceae bacterium]